MRRSLLAALVVATAVAVARAEAFWSAETYADSGEVPLIVEAKIVDGDRVAVTRTLYAATPLPEGTVELRIEGLTKLDRRTDRRAEPPKVLVTDEVVLLLERAGEAWKPFRFIDARGARPGCGATGAYFVRDGMVWCFTQEHSPGPLVLVTWPAGVRKQGTIEQFRTEIADGVAARRAWDEDLAIPDPAERAKRLVRWISPDASPDKGRLAFRGNGAVGELTKLGAPAVPALLGALERTDDRDAGDSALRALAEIGPNAKDAIPRLVELADTPGKLRVESIVRALGETGDARAIPTLRRVLAETSFNEPSTIEAAIRGMRRCKDPEVDARVKAKYSTD